MTTKPFGSVYFSNLIVGSAISADPFAEGTATFAGAFFGGAVFTVSWLKTDTAAMATDRHKINRRLRSAEFIPILLNNCLTLYETQPKAMGLHRIAKHYQDTLT